MAKIRKFKTKRYDEGGDVNEEFAKPIKSTAYAESQTAKKQTFKQAFADARDDDKKTFFWNGKKYNTELASAKPKTSPDQSKAESVRLSRAAGDAARPMEEKGLEGVHPEEWLIGGGAGLGLKAAYRGAKALAESGARKVAQKATEALASANKREALKDMARAGTRAGQREAEDAADMARMGSDFMKKGGAVKKRPVKKMATGGMTKSSSASKRGDGIAQRGKTKGKLY